MKFIDSIRDAWLIRKAGISSNAGRFDEAISFLDKVKSKPRMISTAALKAADILLTGKDVSGAKARYSDFLSRHIENMPMADHQYIQAYARFFLEECERQLGERKDYPTTKKDLERLSKTASFLAKSDFPPP